MTHIKNVLLVAVTKILVVTIVKGDIILILVVFVCPVKMVILFMSHLSNVFSVNPHQMISITNAKLCTMIKDVYALVTYCISSFKFRPKMLKIFSSVRLIDSPSYSEVLLII